MNTRQTMSDEVIRAIRQIEIATKRLLNSAMVGDSRSAMKGTGFEFDQIRDYQMGDDVRFIDWKACARNNKLLVKEYIEERSRTVMLLVDVSASMGFGSVATTKNFLAAQIASTIALVSAYGSDRVGLIMYGNAVEQYMPPAQGMMHARALMEKVFTYNTCRAQTSLQAAAQQLMLRQKKNSVVFIISDFIDNALERYLPVLAQQYDVIAIRCMDKNEEKFPAVGFVEMEDLETGQRYYFDARDPEKLQRAGVVHPFDYQTSLFKKYRVDHLDIINNRPWMSDLVRFFRRRMRY